MNVKDILEKMGICVTDDMSVSQFMNAEDGQGYAAWKIELPEGTFVLKKAKGQELAIYAAFFSRAVSGAPRYINSTDADGASYFLMEYVQGEDLCNCTREKLTAVLDALICLQDHYWANDQLEQVGHSFTASLPGRKRRKDYLKDAQLECAYDQFLEQYHTLPRTLCHDDLLPFNVLIADGRATLIDWEYAGILPYPTSLARLIAHGEEQSGAFFYMTEEDKQFAIDYYYENLIAKKGISYADYRNAMNAFLLYEYCEWIMLGNRYPDADMDRYRSYLEKAKRHLAAMGSCN